MTEAAIVNTFRQDHVSVSRLKLFDQCPLHFWFHYVEHAEPGESDREAALFGSLCHAVLEAIYRWVQEEEHEGVIPEEVIAEFFDQQWGASELTKIEHMRDASSVIRSYFARNPDVNHWDILAVEHRFEIEINGVNVVGYFDRVDRDGADEIVVTDYKTNQMPFTRVELETDLQASIYTIVARRLWPWAKRIVFRFEMLRVDMVQPTERSDEDLDLAERYIAALNRKIEDPGRDEWPGKTGPLCAWCEHRYHCEPFRRVCTEDPIMHPVSEANLLEVSAERERLKRLLAPVEARKKALDRILSKHCGQDGDLELGQYTYRLIKIPRVEYGPDVFEVLARHAGDDVSVEQVRERVIAIEKKAVDDYVAELKRAMTGTGSRAKKAMLSMEIEACKQTGFSHGRLDSRLNANALRETAGVPALPPRGAEQSAASAAPAAPAEAATELACDFCGKKPANLVERGAHRFAVCEDHKRKRKPPKAV